MSLQQWQTSQANPEVVVNENFNVLAALAVYGRDPTTTTGLTWGYYGGRWGGFSVAAGTLTLAASQTNRIVVARATGVISTSTNDTNWDNTADYARVYLLVTGASTVTSFEDHRMGEGGVLAATGGGGGGSTAIPQNSQSAAYALVLDDAGKHILHPSADTTARTWTIPANSDVAFAVGTVVTFVNQNGAGVITIAINSDTMRLAGAGTTGSRTLAANGIATAMKLTSTEWIISGTGLT
jgi:hypothetical protein